MNTESSPPRNTTPPLPSLTPPISSNNPVSFEDVISSKINILRKTRTIPPLAVTQGLVIVCFLLSIICMAAGSYGTAIFALKPSYTISSFFFWNIITGSLFETNIIKAIVQISLIFLVGRQIETYMGSASLLRHLIIVIASTGGILFLVSVITYIWMDADETFIFHEFYSLSVIPSIFLICKWKLNPDLVVLEKPIQIKSKQLPLLNLIIILFSSIILQSWADFFFGFVSLNISWFHLRFFHISSDEQIGDVNSEFEYAALFPLKIRQPVSHVNSIIFNACNACGFFVRQVTVKQNTMDLSVSTDPVAERRRARALKALDEKLAEMSQIKEAV